MPVSRRAFLAGSAVAAAAAATPAAALGRGTVLAAPGLSLLAVRLDTGLLPELLAGFDVTEHVHDGEVEVVATVADRLRLDALGARYRVVDADLLRTFTAARRREQQLAATAPQTRQSYRTLAEYVADLDRLAAIAPQVVRRFELPTPTHQGRRLQGVVLGTGSGVADGRPTAFLCGLHHAREWPSGELTMMFAEDLVDGFLAGDAECVELLSSLRLIVVPVANPDGFVRSRETLPYQPTVDSAVQLAQEGPYQRKNLRSTTGLPVEPQQGVDTNRNYPYAWGGVGASGSSTSQTYYGPAPGSEPEVVAMTDLLRAEQVLAGISNHTHGRLVLRPWGYTSEPSPDEEVLAELGDAMAAFNGYTSGLWNVALYPGTGIVDDWSYGLLGTLCYTLEHGSAFHAAYGDTVPQQYAANRPAFVTMLRAALDERLHGVLDLTGPEGTVVELSKTVSAPLSKPHAGAMEVAETVVTRLVLPRTGTTAWHVNPSPTAATLLADAEPERYAVTAVRPDGTTSLRTDLLVRRGDRHALEV